MKSKELDQFFTKDNVAIGVLGKVKEMGLVNKTTTLIEPSAGDGSFIRSIQKIFPENKMLAFDIDKKHDLVKECDFLSVKIAWSDNYVFVGNPPFGYKGKLAVEFVNKCAELGNVVVFILPIQFRRYNLQRKINSELKLVYSSENLPRNSFLVDNKEYDVNCCVQIWVRDKENKFRDLRVLEKPKSKSDDFEMWIYNNTESTRKYFDKTKYGWDIAIHRQGFYDYNKFVTDPKMLNPKRQYLFVKFKNESVKEIFEKIDFNELAGVNTIIKGFSNTDLVAKYDEVKNEKK